MIQGYPTRILDLLKQNPLCDLDDVHDVLIEMDSKPTHDGKSDATRFSSLLKYRTLDSHRVRRRMLHPNELPEQAAPVPPLFERLASREIGDRVRTELSKLPFGQRDVLTRHFIDGIEINEIAAARRTKPQTVRKLKDEGLCKLRSRLVGLFSEEGAGNE